MSALITVPTLVRGLQQLGVQPGTTLLVHCAMSQLGKIQGGAQALLMALQSQVGESGTLVMPTFTEGRFDPSEWRHPAVPESWWDRIRFETPAFDAQRTPTDRTMSTVYELFRTWPDVIRTNHPHSSIAAWGKHKARITRVHQLDERFGNTSPLGVLYDLDAEVLFLGTTYATNTCFHLAEYRRPNPPVRTFLTVTRGPGRRTLKTYTDVDTDSSEFAAIGAAFEDTHPVQQQFIGSAQCRRFRLRAAVDFAVSWLSQSS